MKRNQLFALAVFAAALALTPAARKDLTVSCAFFCSQIDCIPEDVCGSFVNANGKTVCGCHPRP